MTDVEQARDPVAAVDALVAAVDPGLTSPGVDSSDAVLVTGPWLAGTSSLLAALRERLPEHRFVEADDLGPVEAPAAVVFVVSAVAPITESDCALIDRAAQHTDLVIGAVSKIDVHRNWRDVLDENRRVLAAHAPRFADMPWVGVAAAPDLGETKVDELVDLLRTRLDDDEVKRRNRLRTWESRLDAVIARYERDGAGADRHARVEALKERREAVQRDRRVSKSERTIALRSQIQQARVQLAYFARNRCTSVRTELQEDVSAMTRRRLPDFQAYVTTRVGEVVDEVEAGITKHLGDVAGELGLTAPDQPPPPSPPEVPDPPLKSRRTETRLMMVLGAGFGLGVALGVSRLFAGLAPGLTIAGLAAGGVIGLLVTVWVVGMRGLLSDRAVLDRWIVEVTNALQAVVEERVATRVVAAEAELTADLGRRDEADAKATAAQVAEIDAELREHAIATARAAALRDRRLPPLQKALETVRAELAS
ncbi:hypothetical protein CQY20_11610 [Mycolicibacterium agri]|uniref:Uncharacterized protein n=1 Tax=Mycolicibacterium agri TaxID=36811 RepID=A0A2A7N506_MYCAG|nr:hypothetical protein [Mycolicibacterium agri]PEG38974.1 hypothetical protein CQY20_11610 [Mycolicibacterium agri]GFG53172.1 hypothetical protein MAGR_46130 [Mycolicibacterium agri]